MPNTKDETRDEPSSKTTVVVIVKRDDSSYCVRLVTSGRNDDSRLFVREIAKNGKIPVTRRLLRKNTPGFV